MVDNFGMTTPGESGDVDERGEEYRKTATIRAIQWWKLGDHPAVYEVGSALAGGPTGQFWIDTLEGRHIVTPGDWIATGVKGEHWPIKPDIFALTYEKVAATRPEPAGVGVLEEIARIIREQMREWWDEICSDTGCHPLDIVREGKVLRYIGGHWTDAIAQFAAEKISELPQRSSYVERAWIALAKRPCETEGLEDMEGGCCAPCRARKALIPASGAGEVPLYATPHPAPGNNEFTGRPLGLDVDGMCDDHGRFGCEKCVDALAALHPPASVAEVPASGAGEWQDIASAPQGNEDTGPFIDLMWAGQTHRYKPVVARENDCYRRGDSFCLQHGYPAVTTIFGTKPTHWRPSPALSRPVEAQ